MWGLQCCPPSFNRQPITMTGNVLITLLLLPCNSVMVMKHFWWMGIFFPQNQALFSMLVDHYPHQPKTWSPHTVKTVVLYLFSGPQLWELFKAYLREKKNKTSLKPRIWPNHAWSFCSWGCNCLCSMQYLRPKRLWEFNMDEFEVSLFFPLVFTSLAEKSQQPSVEHNISLLQYNWEHGLPDNVTLHYIFLD